MLLPGATCPFNRDFYIVWTGRGLGHAYVPLYVTKRILHMRPNVDVHVHYQEDDAKSADFTSSSRVVNVRPRCDACAVRVHRDG